MDKRRRLAAEVEALHMHHATMHGLNEPSRWDDLKVFLAVLRAGSFSGAASALAIEQSTVSRRIAALESALSAVLFDRSAAGPRPTELAERLRGHAERMEAELHALLEEASSFGQDVQGRVRVALTESLAVHVVIPHLLPALKALHPRLHIDLLLGERAADLAQREADLALRFFRPTQGDLLAQRVTSLPTVVMGHRKYLAGRTRTPEALDWVVLELTNSTTPDGAFLAAHTSVVPALRTNGHLAQVEAVRAGLGVALLVRSVLKLDPELMEVELGLPPGPAVELWLVAPRSLASHPRVRAVWDFFASALPALGM